MDTEIVRPPFSVQPAEERALFDHGWLQTAHSFSFADYFDPSNLSWGALRVLNDDVVAPGKGFGTHPHRDMEILTYVLDGELEHRDSLGNVGVVGAGGVQYLSAGTGLSHSETNHSETSPLHFVQMWVMPRAQNLAPRYGQVDFKESDRHNRWLTVASGREGVETPISIWQDATAFVARLDASRLTKTVDDGRFAFLFVAAGDEIKFGDDVTLQAGDGVRIKGPFDIAVEGTGELILWDTPSLEQAIAKQ
jgi:redox-sensitive bicupin YhaK (pirin superfamily)